MKKSLYKDQRGMGHAVVVVLIVVVIAVVGVVGWRVMQNNKTPAAAKTTAGKSVNSACLKIYSDKNLCNAAAVSSDFAKLAYTVTDTSTDAQGQTSQITIKSDGKGDTAMSSSAGNQAYNTVTIGSTVYIQNGGSWIKYASNAPAPANPANDLKTAFSDASTPAAQRIQYKSLGKEKCGSATCFKYQVIDPANSGTTTYVWFNASNYRVQRMTTKSAQGTNDFVISYGPVTITAPSPVTSATDAASGAEAQAQAAAAAAAAAAAQSGQ